MTEEDPNVPVQDASVIVDDTPVADNDTVEQDIQETPALTMAEQNEILYAQIEEQDAIEEESLAADIAESDAKIAEEEQRGLIMDAGLGALKIIPSALEQVANTSGELGGLAWKYRALFSQQYTHELVTQSGTYAEDSMVDEYVSDGLDNLATFEFPQLLPETERASGALVKGVGTFIAGFATGQKYLQAASAATKVGRAAQMMTMGAAVDFTLFDPSEDNLSALMQDVPWLANPISEYLATDDEDHPLEGRLKNAFEGAGLGLVADGLLKIVAVGARLVKKGIKAQAKAAELKAEEDMIASITKEGELESKVRPPELKANEVDEVKLKETETPEGATKEAETEPVMTVRVNEADTTEFIDRLLRGDVSDAEELVDFNGARYDLGDAEDGAAAVRDIINTTSEVFEKMMKATGREYQSHKTTARLAKNSGTDPRVVDEVFNDVTRGNGLAARLLAADYEMVASGKRVYKMLQEVEEQIARGDESGVPAFYQQVELHAAIQAEVRGSKKEVARATDAMKIMKKTSGEGHDEFMRILKQHPSKMRDPKSFIDSLKKAKADEAAFNKGIRNGTAPTIRQVLAEVYINGLLSGVKTHEVNTLSNALQVMLGGVARVASAGVGSVRRGFGAKAGDTVTWHEVAAHMQGTAKGAWEGIFLAARAFKEGRPIGDTVQRIENVNRNAIGIDTATIAKWRLQGDHGKEFFGHGINVLGAAIRFPSRMLITGDEFFKSIATSSERHALSVRNAYMMADAKNLTGAKRDTFVAKSIDDLRKNPTEEFEAAAMEFARKQTFQEESTGFAKKFETMLNGAPFAKIFVVPFFRTPMNIFKQALGDYTPASLVWKGSEKLHRRMRGMDEILTKGGQDTDIAIAKMMVGGTMMASAYSLWESGNITGNQGGYKNSQLLDGRPANSIKMFGTWVPIARLDPLGTIFSLTTFVADYTAENWDDDPESQSIVGLVTKATAAGIFDVVLNKTWMKGVSDILEVVTTTADQEANSELLERWFERQTLMMIPYSSQLRTLSVAQDGYMREAFDFGEKLRKNTLNADDLPFKRDILGRPRVASPESASYWNAFAVSKKSTDPVELELARLATDFSMPSKKIEKVPLTATQYSRMLELAGSAKIDNRSLMETLSDAINNPEYQAIGTDEAQVVIIKGFISGYHALGKQLLLRENKELRLKVAPRNIERLGKREGMTDIDIKGIKKGFADNDYRDWN